MRYVTGTMGTNQKVLAANGTVACLNPTASADVRTDIKDMLTTAPGRSSCAAVPIPLICKERRQGYKARLGSGNEDRY